MIDRNIHVIYIYIYDIYSLGDTIVNGIHVNNPDITHAMGAASRRPKPLWSSKVGKRRSNSESSPPLLVLLWRLVPDINILSNRRQPEIDL